MLDGNLQMKTQQDAIDLIQSGQNVDLSGNAGTGKSTIINQIMNRQTALMAPTGIAALNIGAETCHSCIGLPFGMPTEEDKHKKNRSFVELFGNDTVNRLIIDEKSMLRADHFDLIDYKLRGIKNCDEPFGGLQIVVVGDYWQLPCIVGTEEKKFFRRQYKSGFIFDSKVYKQANFNHILLEKSYRQHNLDQVELLNAIQSKKTGWEDAVNEINSICQAEHDDNVLHLCVFNKDADIVNSSHYNKNNNLERKYTAKIEGKFRQRDCIVDEEIYLKEGLRVIVCANNIEEGYKNGQMGELLELLDESVIVRLDDGDVIEVVEHEWESLKYKNSAGGLKKTVIGKCKQLPIRQANAISVHKCLSGDTQIETPNGKVHLKNIQKGDKVLSENGFNKVINKWSSGVKKAFKVTLESGREIISSEDHQFFCSADGELPVYIELKDIKEGDYLTLNSKSIEYNSNYDNSLCYVIGILIGDGCYSKGNRFRMDITNTDEEVLSSFAEFFEDKDITVGKYNKKNSEHIKTYVVNKKEEREYFLDLGLEYVTSCDKRIPDWLKYSSKENRLNVIAGLVDTDGCVKKETDKLVYVTCSEKLSLDIQEILDSLGVYSSVYKTKNAYYLNVTGKSSVILSQMLKNYCRVGYKKRRLEELSEKKFKRENRDIIPFSGLSTIFIADSIRKKGEMLKNYKDILHRGKTIKCRYSFIDNCLKEDLEFPPYINKETRYEKIVKIEEVKSEEMFDIEVENDHNFFANGILVHNCQSLTLNEVAINMGKGAFTAGLAYVALSRVRDLTNISLTRPLTEKDVIIDKNAQRFFRGLKYEIK